MSLDGGSGVTVPDVSEEAASWPRTGCSVAAQPANRGDPHAFGDARGFVPELC